MDGLAYRWSDASGSRLLELVRVRGTDGEPYDFGEPGATRPVEVSDFFIATVPVTQALWTHVMGSGDNPSCNPGPELPVENVSWDALVQPGGFLERVNAGPVVAELGAPDGQPLRFRLPSETEWEYAARGGPHWGDGFRFSGSDDIDAVAWYDRRHGDWTQPVGRKAPNQLGLFDMSGNVWEWCQDVYTMDLDAIPADGRAFSGPGDERVLRGGCFHNWAIHCTVSKRYEIAQDFHDGCIGLRLVLAHDREHDEVT